MSLRAQVHGEEAPIQLGLIEHMGGDLWAHRRGEPRIHDLVVGAQVGGAAGAGAGRRASLRVQG
jgi:hypothetical protein